MAGKKYQRLIVGFAFSIWTRQPQYGHQ